MTETQSSVIKLVASTSLVTDEFAIAQCATCSTVGSHEAHEQDAYANTVNSFTSPPSRSKLDFRFRDIYPFMQTSVFDTQGVRRIGMGFPSQHTVSGLTSNTCLDVERSNRRTRRSHM